ncbi:MAG: hypothetical protein M1829_002076 [Trizodia sp. TS-e1964]|nr:MAG: hypothetical protein M1829_002076 [Trizodia sp. TS-e1964]
MLVPPTAMIEKLANINRKPEDINHRHCKTQAETDPAKNILYQAGALGATGLATIPAYYGAKNVLRVGNNLINGEIRNGVRMPRLYTPKAFAKLTPEQARQLKPEDLAKLKPKAAAKLLPETITEIPLESLGRIPDKSALKISDDAMNSLERALGTEGSSARQEFLELSSSGLTKLRPWLVNLFVKTAIKAAEK